MLNSTSAAALASRTKYASDEPPIETDRWSTDESPEETNASPSAGKASAVFIVLPRRVQSDKM